MSNQTVEPTPQFTKLAQTAKEFFDLLPSVSTVEQIEAGMKCFGITFLELKGATDNEKYQAEILLCIVHKKGHNRTRDILFAPFRNP